jgi:Niemann-Pick C1 protein
VCGSDFSTRTCCTQGQLDVLSSSLAQAEALTATCPACHNNFRHFFCQLSCSPDQSLFMEVTSTQNLTSGGETKTAVKSVEFLVGAFAEGFYDSCKDVKFGATNGRAMDLLGGGAGTALQFLQFLGESHYRTRGCC